MRKLTIEEVKEKIKKVHGDIVSLDMITYAGTKTKARFIDVIYGEWWAKPDNIFQGRGHPDRGIQKSAEAKLLDVEEIKERLFKVHGLEITLDESTYTNITTKSIFVDILYGRWLATPHNVLQGKGHPDREKEKKIKTFIKNYDEDHPSKSPRVKEKIRQGHLIDIEDIEKRLYEIHGDDVVLVRDTYVDISTKAIFIHKKYKKWEAVPNSVLRGTSHPDGAIEKSKRTLNKKYGKDHPGKILEFSLKAARNSTKSVIKFHWKTGEELVCVASYECETVEYFNINKINFDWQPKTFTMPNGKTYRPDAYLPDQNIWVEIKGYMRPKNKEKWDWFKSEYPTAELWDRNKLRSMGIMVK